MGISSDMKMLFRFSETISDFWPEILFLPTVSDVIEQSIRGNFNRIFHATCFQTIPSLAYVR